MNSCDNCKYENVSMDNIPCIKCKRNYTDKWEMKTNADRIRAMSDEELAELIATLSRYCLLDASDDVNCRHESCTNCKNVAERWLRKEVKE